MAQTPGRRLSLIQALTCSSHGQPEPADSEPEPRTVRRCPGEPAPRPGRPGARCQSESRVTSHGYDQSHRRRGSDGQARAQAQCHCHCESDTALSPSVTVTRTEVSGPRAGPDQVRLNFRPGSNHDLGPPTVLSLTRRRLPSQ